ncbi:hypothetical protein [Risungbinella massiliensis]|uniref:hypothetical protein n=1 Tax=Risungbinella massiliensis TaxID=1329796 RepID=UPI0011CB1BB4|nr:hypothetical protein [Risungbinella massiliensis]
MTEGKLRALRKTQFLMQNITYLLYGALLALLILVGASGPIVYGVLALLLLISPLTIWFFKKTHPIYVLVPSLRELESYEKEKLQGAWQKFYSGSSLLQVAISLFFVVQVIIRDPQRPFVDGLPIAYFIVVCMAFLLLANWNDWSNAARIDQKTTEQLQSFTDDRFLMTVIFGGVALVMTGLGWIVINVMTSITPV